MSRSEADPTNPEYYQSDNGDQLIDVVRCLPFSLGNALKYVYRRNNKDNAELDVRKALWYINDFHDHPVAVNPSYNDVEFVRQKIFDDPQTHEVFRNIAEFYDSWAIFHNRKKFDEVFAQLSQSIRNLR